MKYIFLLLFPVLTFAQDMFDHKNQLAINFDQPIGFFNQTTKQDLLIVKADDSFGLFNEEMKSLGIQIDRNQRQFDYGYKWNENQSPFQNLIGSIMNNILNKKKLNP